MAGFISFDEGVPLAEATPAPTVLIDGFGSLKQHPLWDGRDGYDVAQAYGDVPALRTVVDFIARAVASTPLQVFQRVDTTDRQRVTDGPIVEALSRPSRWQTQAQFIGAIIRDRLLTDRWAALHYEDDFGRRRLLRIPPQMLRVELDGYGEVSGVLVVHEGQELRPREDELLFWAGYSYSPGRAGTSPVRSVQRLLREIDEADDYRRKTYRNGVRSPFALVRPADAAPWTSEQRTKFIGAFRENYAGPEAAHSGGVPLLEDGMTPVPFTGTSPKDLEATSARQATLVEMANAYHLPPELLGLRESKYASMKEYRSQLYRDVLGPIFVDLQQTLTAQLVPALGAGPDTYVEANLEAKLRGSFEEQVAYLQAAVGGPYMTRAEARGLMNLPFVEGTDDLIVPLNVLVGGQASPQDSVTQREKSERPPLADRVRALKAAHGSD